MNPRTHLVRFRVVTYNIHKCRGFDRRTMPERIISVLREMEADLICLQEVVNAPSHSARFDQAARIERAFPNHTPSFGANRDLHGGTYGNLTLSRFPVPAWKNTDISYKREERGVLRTDLSLGKHRLLHVFNVHLGTGIFERRHQAQLLMGKDILGASDISGPRL